MTPELVIGVLILALAVLRGHLLRTGRIVLGLGVMQLEIEAAKARDRKRQTDHT